MYEQLAFPLECHLGDCHCHSHNGFLTKAGYRALDMAEQNRYLDTSGSVSALVEVEVNDDQIDEQYRRFLNGS